MKYILFRNINFISKKAKIKDLYRWYKKASADMFADTDAKDDDTHKEVTQFHDLSLNEAAH